MLRAKATCSGSTASGPGACSSLGVACGAQCCSGSFQITVFSPLEDKARGCLVKARGRWAVTRVPLPVPQLVYAASAGLCVAVLVAFQLTAFTFRHNLAATALLLLLFGYVTRSPAAALRSVCWARNSPRGAPGLLAAS